MRNWIRGLVHRFEAWMLDDGLNHDWDESALTREHAMQSQAHLRSVEERAPIESQLKAIARMGGLGDR